MSARDSSLGHPLRGVSVHHLETELLEQVRAVGLPESAKVYEIEPLVIRPKGAHLVCPRSGRLGAAYVDSIHGREHAGMSHYMLSYTWGYRVDDIVSALAQHCRSLGLDSRDTYVWICCLCINQHRVKEALAEGLTISFHEFRAEFADRVKGIGHVLALMTPWNSPGYVTRVWCIFELFTAVSLGQDCELTVLMPPSQARQLYQAVVRGALNARLWASLENVRVQDAEASVPADRENIMQLVEAGAGCECINEAARKRLLRWFADAAAGEAERRMKDGTLHGESAASACSEVAGLLHRCGQTDRGASLLTAARHAAEGVESCEAANLWRVTGMLRGAQRDLQGEEEAYREATAVLRRIGQLQSHDGACVLTCSGTCTEQRGDVEGALQQYREAWRVRRAIEADSTMDAADLLAMMGKAECQLGLVKEGLEHLEKGRDMMESFECLETPHGATVLQQLGTGRRLAGDYKAALGDLEESRRILRLCGAVETLQGVGMLKELSRCQGLVGKAAEELRLLREARAILEKNGQLHSEFGVRVLQDLACALWDGEEDEEAREVVGLARDICEERGLLQTELGKLVLKRVRGMRRSRLCICQ